MNTLGATICNLYVLARLACNNSELIGSGGYGGAERRTSQHLAVLTMTNIDCSWFNFRIVSNCTTVALSLHLHDASIAADGSYCNARRSVTSISRAELANREFGHRPRSRLHRLFQLVAQFFPVPE